MYCNEEKQFQLVKFCLNYIRKKSKYFSCRSNLEYEDFYQSGFEGMMVALQKLRPEEPLGKQIVFVVQYIVHEMVKEIRRCQHPVYIPTHLNKKINSGELTFSRTNADKYPQLIERKEKQSSDMVMGLQKSAKQTSDVFLNLNHREMLEKSFNYLLVEKMVVPEEIVCFNLFYGLFSYPKFPIEQIGKFFKIPTNTASKRILKVMKLLKSVVPALFSINQL